MTMQYPRQVDWCLCLAWWKFKTNIMPHTEWAVNNQPLLEDSPQNIKLTGNRISLHFLMHEEQKKDVFCLDLITTAQPFLSLTLKGLTGLSEKISDKTSI